MRHQETALQQAVPDLLKKLARRVHRAATRGLPGNKLKTAFDFLALMVVIQPRAPSAPWDGQLPSHGADALVHAPRDRVRLTAKVGDISVLFREVTLQIPTHKTTHTHRAHALLRARHLARLRALGADSPDSPLFPDRLGGTTTKRDWVAMLERVLAACRVGTPGHRPGRRSRRQGNRSILPRG